MDPVPFLRSLARAISPLDKEQWLKLLSMSDEIRAFIAENEAKLKTKGDIINGRT